MIDFLKRHRRVQLSSTMKVFLVTSTWLLIIVILSGLFVWWYRSDGRGRASYGDVFYMLYLYDHPDDPCSLPLTDPTPRYCPVSKAELEREAQYFWVDAWETWRPILLGIVVVTGIPLAFIVTHIVRSEREQLEPSP